MFKANHGFTPEELDVLLKAYEFFSDSDITVQVLKVETDISVYIGGLICYGAKKLRDKERLKTLTREDIDRYIINRMKEKHESLARHGYARVLVRCSRTTSHQLTRHAFIDLHQRSQRYCIEDKTRCIIPPSIKARGTAEEIYLNCIKYTINTYKQLIDLGIKKEDARYVLPNGVLTELILTGNFQAWRDFFKLRLDKHAQWEVRGITYALRDALVKKSKVFDEYLKYSDLNGIEDFYTKDKPLELSKFHISF